MGSTSEFPFNLTMLHVPHISANVTNPADGQPWRDALPAPVWWQTPPSQEMENGLSNTARLLGVQYKRVQSVHDANLRVWADSWAYKCKWITSHAFISLDSTPSPCGGQTGDIYFCRLTTPITVRKLSDYSIIAHEAAHIFAAQPHFGDGLMAKGGGKHAQWFTDEEVRTMRTRINNFRNSDDQKCEPTTRTRNDRSPGK